jgi:hypothetical protein
VNALADGAWTLAGEIRNRYQALTEAPILTIDIAAAIAGKTNKASLESLFNDAILSRWGIWTTVNYRPKAKDFYATLLARMLGNPSFSTYDDSSNLYDFGFKLNYDIGRFNLSCEYLGRIQWAAQTETYHRFALVANCLLMNNMYLNASIGKNFVGSNKLIALAGINFGISKDKLKLTK